MKKLSALLFILVAILFFSGCAIGNQSTNQHYDIATTYLKVKHIEIKDKKSLETNKYGFNALDYQSNKTSCYNHSPIGRKECIDLYLYSGFEEYKLPKNTSIVDGNLIVQKQNTAYQIDEYISRCSMFSCTESKTIITNKNTNTTQEYADGYDISPDGSYIALCTKGKLFQKSYLKILSTENDLQDIMQERVECEFIDRTFSKNSKWFVFRDYDINIVDLSQGKVIYRQSSNGEYIKNMQEYKKIVDFDKNFSKHYNPNVPRLLYKKEEIGWYILNEELVILHPNLAIIALGENLHKYIFVNEPNIDENIKVQFLRLLTFDAQNLMDTFRFDGTPFVANVKYCYNCDFADLHQIQTQD